MEFNIDPYYDDFKENALDNNYMKILFKPGRAVQARELTQIQSILQNQIKAFGDHVFQDGSPVIGGNMTLDNKCKYLKLEKTYSTIDIDITDFEDRVIRNASGNVQAKVLATYYPFEGEPTLMIRYVTGNEFQNGDVIKVAGESTEAQANSSSASGLGTVVSINEGIFYADGYFVKVLDQTAVVSAYSSSANVKIGLEINEEIVDSEIDTTLLDPAQSSFNYQAPGADRFQFSLILSTRPLDTVVDESKFFELMRVESGIITKQVKYPIYAELEKTLARRTYDESGDYTVKPFRASIVNGVDDDQYTIAVEPGKAYVKGFEFETLGTMKINVDKPRGEADVKRLVETDVDISYGNYIYVTGLRGSSNGFVNIASLETVDLHCVDTSSVNVGLGYNANTYVYQNTKMGTARVKNFVRHTADAFNAITDSDGVFKLYLSDISLRPIVTKVTAASSNANTIRLSDKFSQKDNAYVNVSVTVLPISLTAVSDVLVNTAVANAFTINANNSGTFNSKLSVGDIIRIGDDVREVVTVSGGNLTVNTELSRTWTNNASIPVEVFKQVAYSSNVTNQTRSVVRYHGTSKTLFLDREFDDGAKIGGAVANASTIVQLNFKIDQVESFIAGPVVANSVAIVANSSMNVSGYSKFLTGETTVEENSKQAMIFRLPRAYAKRGSINNSDYIHNKLIPNRSPTSPGSGVFQISSGSGLVTSFETLPWADSTGSIQDNLIVVVKDDGGDGTVANGDVLQLTSANVTKTNDSLQINTGLTALAAVDIIVSVKQNDAEDKIRRKVFQSNTSYDTTAYFTRGTVSGGVTTITQAVSNAYPTTTTNANTNIEIRRLGSANVAYGNVDIANGLIFITNVDYTTIRPGDSISLYVPDVVKIRKVFAGTATALPNGVISSTQTVPGFRDITDHFFVDYGQRDDRYDHAKLILREGYDSPSAQLLVHVDFYQHIYATGSNVSFFSVDSYPEDHYTSGIIPIYTSSSGTVYDLRDCLDFRPTQTLGDGDLKYTVPATQLPDDTTELSYDYYLPRIDKLVLSKDKEFRVVKGKSAPQPLPPEDLDDAMTLYTIYLPPYVAEIRDVRLNYRENRRYTMRDIASIDKRLERVEYFTALNNVEKLAMADKTQYEDGTEKEKYGIVGENFTNFNIVDYKNPDFNVALENGFMIPSMKVYSLGLKSFDKNNTTVNRKTVCLSYAEVPAIVQGLASDKSVSVQPFLFGQFNGSLALTPETDVWVSETLKPEVITVPEKIIEKETVIRETVVEPPPPTTLKPPTNNSDEVVIKDPGTTPTTPDPEDKVIIPPAEPDRPIIGEPAEPKKILPTNEPYPEIIFEWDPWWSITPINFGVNFTFGATGYNPGNLFSNGGIFNEDYWYPAATQVSGVVQPEPNYESSLPTTLPPIQLDYQSGLDSGGGFAGKGQLDISSYSNFKDK
jgi:hypothetical protein